MTFFENWTVIDFMLAFVIAFLWWLPREPENLVLQKIRAVVNWTFKTIYSGCGVLFFLLMVSVIAFILLNSTCIPRGYSK